MANKIDRVFGGKLDEFLLSKGGIIIQERKSYRVFEEYSSEYLREFTQGGETHIETKTWNAFSFGYGAVKIRTAGKGQALLYTETEEIPISTVELREELDDYLALFEDEIRAAEEAERQREEERRLMEEAANLEREKKESWEKEVPALVEELMGKEVRYLLHDREYVIKVTTRQKYEWGRYVYYPTIRIEKKGVRDYWTKEFDLEPPHKNITTGAMDYPFDEAPEGVRTYGDLYEYIKTH